jgi:hypothetical protein
MFKYIVTAAVALLATPAFGANADQGSGSNGSCAAIGDAAESMFNYRYQGFSLSQVMGLTASVKDQEIRKLFRSMIIDAFRRPLFTTPDYIEQDRQEFRSLWEMACYEAGLETI